MLHFWPKQSQLKVTGSINREGSSQWMNSWNIMERSMRYLYHYFTLVTYYNNKEGADWTTVVEFCSCGNIRVAGGKPQRGLDYLSSPRSLQPATFDLRLVLSKACVHL